MRLSDASQISSSSQPRSSNYNHNGPQLIQRPSLSRATAANQNESSRQSSRLLSTNSSSSTLTSTSDPFGFLESLSKTCTTPESSENSNPSPSLSERGLIKTPMELLSESMRGRMLFAIPKKGRLYQKSLEMLEGADIKFTRSHRLDVCLVQNHDIALVFLPASDIPRFVAHGNVDMGITGRDTILESKTESDITELLELGFGACKLQVQVPEKEAIVSVEQLAGKRVVTSYTTVAREYFKKLDAKLGLTEENATQVDYVGGSVEAACALGLADGIVDLVESGETMRAAGLHAIATVMSTEAVLIKSSNPKHPNLLPLIKKVASRIAGFVASNKYVLCQYNIPRELLPICSQITPGRRAPTISSIEDDGWVAVSAMVEKKIVADVMDKLVEAGAEDTFIISLQNCRVESRVGSSEPTTSNKGIESPVLQRAGKLNGNGVAGHVDEEKIEGIPNGI